MGLRNIIYYVKNLGLLGKKKVKPIFTKDFIKDKAYQIGEYTYGNPTILYPNENAKLVIGKFCSIASGVKILLGGNHRVDWITTYPFNVIFNEHPVSSDVKGHPNTKGDVKIGHDVWIGMNSLILSGLEIGNGAVIAANSVVTKHVPPYTVVGGNPAKILHKRFSDDQIESLLALQWWNWPLEKILNNSQLLCSRNFEELIINT